MKILAIAVLLLFTMVGCQSKPAGKTPAVAAEAPRVIKELTNRLKPEDPDDLENEYTLNEFLDKYGIRLGQLATILSQVGPLAEAAPAPEAPPA